MRPALLAALLFACSRTAAPSRPTSQPEGAPPAALTGQGPAAPHGSCDAMTAAECLQSPSCVLVRTAPLPQAAYACRPAAGPCEGGVGQFDARFAADCAARAGCRFAAPECFCPSTAHTRVPSLPSPVACTCGGGEPPRCVPAG